MAADWQGGRGETDYARELATELRPNPATRARGQWRRRDWDTVSGYPHAIRECVAKPVGRRSERSLWYSWVPQMHDQRQ